jgi:hypothetical protein
MRLVTAHVRFRGKSGHFWHESGHAESEGTKVKR